ncbi:hypothetical protein ACOMHN_019700 [Nucella lapillus]
MSSHRKCSVFNPPPFPPTPIYEYPKAGIPGTSQAEETVLRRKFSHEETPIPIPLDTTAEDLIFIEAISCSTLADVVRVQRKDTKDILIAKAFNHSSWRSEYLCGAELRVLQDVNSPWIVNFYGYIQDFNEDFLLFEYLPNGSLLDLINKLPLTENQVKFYTAEMFLAIDSLHHCGIMHRNIQLSNFLIHCSGHLRLTGFGMSYRFSNIDYIVSESPAEKEDKHSLFKAKRKPKLSRITNPVFASPDKAIPVSSRFEHKEAASVISPASVEHSVNYMAPEVLRLVMPKPYFTVGKRKMGYSYLCDYWSLGVALYRMLYGYYPFIADSKGLILDKVMKFRNTLVFPLSHVSEEASSLVKELLKKESERLGRHEGFAEIKHHGFFTDMEWTRLGHGKVAVPVRCSDLTRYTATGLGGRLPAQKPTTNPTPTPTLTLTQAFFTSTPSFKPRPERMSVASSSSDSFENKAIEQLDMNFSLPLCSDPTIHHIDWCNTQDVHT